MSKVIQNLFSKKETAQILGLKCERSVARLIQDSKLKAVHIGRSVKITFNSINDYFTLLTGDKLCLSEI